VLVRLSAKLFCHRKTSDVIIADDDDMTRIVFTAARDGKRYLIEMGLGPVCLVRLRDFTYALYEGIMVIRCAKERTYLGWVSDATTRSCYCWSIFTERWEMNQSLSCLWETRLETGYGVHDGPWELGNRLTAEHVY